MALNPEAKAVGCPPDGPPPAAAAAASAETDQLLRSSSSAGPLSKSLPSVEGEAPEGARPERNGHASLPCLQGGSRRGRRREASWSSPPLSPSSPSKLSLAPASSSATASQLHEARRPRDYLLLAIVSCFCPIWPVNILALVFAIMSRKSSLLGDMDGGRRLGRVARFLSIISIILGSLIIIICSMNFAGVLTSK